MKHYFSRLMVSGFLAICSFSSFADEVEDEQKMPVPIIKHVVFYEGNNPYTKRDIYNLEKEIDPNLCKGFTLTEADVREFFKIARRANANEAHEFYPSECNVGGDLILEDGKKVNFEIDRARQGNIHIEKGINLLFYCAKCKHPAYDEVCDIECLNAKIEEGHIFTHSTKDGSQSGLAFPDKKIYGCGIDSTLSLWEIISLPKLNWSNSSSFWIYACRSGLPIPNQGNKSIDVFFENQGMRAVIALKGYGYFSYSPTVYIKIADDERSLNVSKLNSGLQSIHSSLEMGDRSIMAPYIRWRCL